MLAPDTVLQNRYRIIKKLGQGGMGTVYEAFDQRLYTTVALKESVIINEQLQRQFEHEARILAQLSHPALTKVFDHFTEGDKQYLVMEFVPGDDLWELLLRQRAPFPIEDVLRWCDQLLDALDYLHTRHPPVIHRDIKPQNLKLSDRGQIMLLDFGLAKGVTGQLSQTHAAQSVFGYTLSYAALEQIQGTGTDPRSDLYSLAATLYHLMTGSIPPDALTRITEVANDNLDPLRFAAELNPNVPPAVAEILRQALSQNRDRRPASAAQMREMFFVTTKPVTRPYVTSKQGDAIKTPVSLPLDPSNNIHNALTRRYDTTTQGKPTGITDSSLRASQEEAEATRGKIIAANPQEQTIAAKPPTPQQAPQQTFLAGNAITQEHHSTQTGKSAPHLSDIKKKSKSKLIFLSAAATLIAILFIGISAFVISRFANGSNSNSDILAQKQPTPVPTPVMVTEPPTVASPTPEEITVPDLSNASPTPVEQTKPTPTPTATPKPTPSPTEAQTETETQAPSPTPQATPNDVVNGRIVSMPKPEYPPIAKTARASGLVVVQVTINENGRVISASAISGHPLLKESAVQAAYKARFTTTYINGQPSQVTKTINYNFQP